MRSRAIFVCEGWSTLQPQQFDPVKILESCRAASAAKDQGGKGEIWMITPSSSFCHATHREREACIEKSSSKQHGKIEDNCGVTLFSICPPFATCWWWNPLSLSLIWNRQTNENKFRERRGGMAPRSEDGKSFEAAIQSCLMVYCNLVNMDSFIYFCVSYPLNLQTQAPVNVFGNVVFVDYIHSSGNPNAVAFVRTVRCLLCI